MTTATHNITSNNSSPPWTTSSSPSTTDDPNTTYMDFASLEESYRRASLSSFQRQPEEDGIVVGIKYDDDDEHDEIHTDSFFASNCQPLLPSKLLCCCSRNNNKINNQSQRDDPPTPQLIFSSPASYHLWTWILLALLPLSTILGTIMVYYTQDPTLSTQQKTQAVIGLSTATVVLFVAYFVGLPRRLEVYSDASIHIVTWLIAYDLGDVLAAYQDPPLLDLCSYMWNTKRGKWDVTTNFEKCVLVKRTMGKWDVYLSPQQPELFVDAIWKVAVDMHHPTKAKMMTSAPIEQRSSNAATPQLCVV